MLRFAQPIILLAVWSLEHVSAETGSAPSKPKKTEDIMADLGISDFATTKEETTKPTPIPKSTISLVTINNDTLSECVFQYLEQLQGASPKAHQKIVHNEIDLPKGQVREDYPQITYMGETYKGFDKVRAFLSQFLPSGISFSLLNPNAFENAIKQLKEMDPETSDLLLAQIAEITKPLFEDPRFRASLQQFGIQDIDEE